MRIGLVADPALKRSERWTPVLSVLVIAVAILLGLLLGWRTGVGGRPGSDRRAATGASSAPIANSGIEPVGEHKTLEPGNELGSSAGHVSVPQNKMLGGAMPGEPPTGGLQVTQNGKVIYRLPPAEQATAKGDHAPSGASADQQQPDQRMLPALA